jgi:3'-5' exoribonuclease
MGRQWTKDLRERTSVHEVYLVTHKAMPLSKNGKPYLSLNLTDRTGSLDARVWENVSVMSGRFEGTDFVRVKGTTVLYQDRLQLHVQSLERVDESTVSATDFLPRSTTPPEVMWSELTTLLGTVKNVHLRKLLDQILADEAFLEAYQRVPAGKSIHHARLAGLLEHSLSVCKLVESICATYTVTYPDLLDRDLLLTAAFLHDAGKTRELSTERKFEYTDVGRLVGHIVLGLELVSAHLERLEGFPEDLALHLRHLLLSHHGELEYGSPKRPKTAEAWILHFVDLLDCRIDQTADLLAQLPTGGWTPYQKIHDRYFWRGHDRNRDPGSEPEADTPDNLDTPDNPDTPGNPDIKE